MTTKININYWLLGIVVSWFLLIVQMAVSRDMTKEVVETTQCKYQEAQNIMDVPPIRFKCNGEKVILTEINEATTAAILNDEPLICEKVRFKVFRERTNWRCGQ